MTTLIDELLREQQSLSAVDRFSRRHNTSAPGKYRDLIPISRPGKGEQYAFEVDLDACSGCKACVSACHSLNGLDDDEAWRDVGTLISKDREGTPSQQTVTSTCHHCLDPACANGCPTMAYEKDDITGVVRHLDDQCIGCRYCELKCSYGVPKYNSRLGIVRKCDMCHSRLAEGEAPACVQACPNEAIRISVISREEVMASSTPGAHLLPGTVASDYTIPTTQYRNIENRRHAVPSDQNRIEPAHGHFPLAFMLAMTQVGAGLTLADWSQRFLVQSKPGWQLAALAVLVSLAGITGSIFHLGRPAQAWKAFLGWKTSWLSREIIAFGGWGCLLLIYLGFVLLGGPAVIAFYTGAAASLAGLVGVFTSVMVYADTRREFWAFRWTTMRFFSTIASATLLCSSIPSFAIIPLLGALLVDGFFVSGLNPMFHHQKELMQNVLRNAVLLRVSLAIGAIGTIHFPFFALGFLLLSELTARSIFFRSVFEPKMPG